MPYQADLKQSEYRTELEHARKLYEALAHSKPEKIAREFHIRRELQKLGYRQYWLPGMFSQDEQLLSILGSRLARTQDMAELQALLQVTLEAVPEIASLKDKHGHSLASNTLLYAAENRTAPETIRKILECLDKNGIDLTAAACQLKFKGTPAAGAEQTDIVEQRGNYGHYAVADILDSFLRSKNRKTVLA